MSERKVTRCPECRLNQFMTKSQKCRRCDAPLVESARMDAAPILPTNLPPMPPAKAPDIQAGMAEAIKVLRLANGLSQMDLAHVMGDLPRTYVSKVENMKALPNVKSVYRFASAMNVSAESLVALAEYYGSRRAA